MSVWRFADWIAPAPRANQVTLGEGETPLVRSRRIGPQAGLEQLYFKLESSNPTGSYKDRFAAVAISDMLAAGKSQCIATSSGNTGAALAAYCAAAQLACEIAIVEMAPAGKLSQMLAYGARLKRVRGFGIDPQITQQTFQRLVEIGNSDRAALQISSYHYSPRGMSGVQTISYELDEQARAIGVEMNHVFVPAGGGGLALAVARGFQRVRQMRESAKLPAVHVVQPQGNDTMATPLRNNLSRAQAVTCTSAISGLQVPTVIDGNETIVECRKSAGTGYTVTDDDVWRCQARLACEEGIFCEPAGAVALAGALKARETGEVSHEAVVVCLITGSGFKDSASTDRMTKSRECILINVNEL